MGENIIERIHYVSVLVAVEARYHNSCMKKLYCSTASGRKRGYRPATNVDEAMEAIYLYLDENSEECQFSIDKLVDQIEGDRRSDSTTILWRLLRKYGDDIVIATTSSKPMTVLYLNTGYRILTNSWFENKRRNPKKDRLRVVQATATIVLEDIRSQVYETKQNPSDHFLKDANTVIPETLPVFLQDVIVKKHGSTEKW